MRRYRHSRRQFLSILRRSVRAGEFPLAQCLFGNDSDAGFLFLEEALPLIPESDRREAVVTAWVRGHFGEHAFSPGDKSLRGQKLARRTVALFRSQAAHFEHQLPEFVVLYRGVRAPSEMHARVAAYSCSWSFSREVAAWFALRYSAGSRHASWVLTATVPREDVLAVLLDREEQEAVIDPFGRMHVQAAGHPTDADIAGVARINAQRRADHAASNEAAVIPHSVDGR